MSAAATAAAAAASTESSGEGPTHIDLLTAVIATCLDGGGWLDRPGKFVGGLGTDLDNEPEPEDWGKLVRGFGGEDSDDYHPTTFPHFRTQRTWSTTRMMRVTTCRVCNVEHVAEASLQGSPIVNAGAKTREEDVQKLAKSCKDFCAEHNHRDLYKELRDRLFSGTTKTKSVRKRA